MRAQDANTPQNRSAPQNTEFYILPNFPKVPPDTDVDENHIYNDLIPKPVSHMNT